MKRIVILSLCLAASWLKGQVRTSLLEEFTGENCVPCAAYNPALDVLMAKPANAAKMIVIKWQVPVPTAPSSSNSLYQTNQAEIHWRHRGNAMNGYGYQHQNTPTSNATDGVHQAPTCRIDGKDMWAFGATSNHPFHLNDNVITAAQTVSTPFSISMSPAWDNSFSNCAVSVTVSASSAFTASGNLKFRLCLVERVVMFSSSPGINGETVFHDVVRKSYPVQLSGNAVTDMGTSLPGFWTPGMMQTFTVNCAVPSYVNDKSQMAFVGFVQDDGDKVIYQAQRTAQPAMPNNAKAGAIDLPLLVCGTAIQPTISIVNNGPNAITAFTLTPSLDGTPLADVTWSGNLASAASVDLQLNSIPVGAGTHTFAYTITQVSGNDYVLSNNQASKIFMNASAYLPPFNTEGFESAVFPPAGWMIVDYGDGNKWEKYNAGAYGTSSRSIGYKLYSSVIGEMEELWLPPTHVGDVSKAKLYFDRAYTGPSVSDDSLIVLLSEDCGLTWKRVYENGGADMHTAWYSGNAQFDPLPGQWETDTVSLGSKATVSDLLLKFQLKSDQGSNLYLDNIGLRVSGVVTTGIEQQYDASIGVYPNPLSGQFLTVVGNEINESGLRVLNTLGECVPVKVAPGNRYTLDCTGLANGMYVLQLKTGDSVRSHRFVIAR